MHLLYGQLKVVLVLALLQELDVRTQKDIFRKHFNMDLLECPQCFLGQREQCEKFFDTIEEPAKLDRLWKDLTLLVDPREIYWLELNENRENVKCLAKRKMTRKISKDLHFNPGGFQMCRNSTRFLAYLEERGYLPATIGYYIHHSISPLLMQELWIMDFPVPRSFAVCGSTLFQAYAGSTLSNYLKAPIDLRLEMAKQLLQLALKLSAGFKGFRIYLTDFTADNFAYNEANGTVLLIDMDTMVLVESNDEAESESQLSKKYKPFPGEGFTYDVNAFCDNQDLDANIYQVCLLLRDQLLPDVKNHRLKEMLNDCVQCEDDKCDIRFKYANNLIDLLVEINNKIEIL
ncbi:divergent protein kinase domain 2A [Drosophila willistoni]|nr:divergent protein kinase domain 2A [Drosophila willistoni]